MSRGTTDPIPEGSPSLTEPTKEGVAQMADKAKDSASPVTSRIGQATSAVAQKTGEMAAALGGRARETAHSVVETVEAGGTYVRDKGLRGMSADLGDVIGRNPLPALALGFTIGFTISRILARRN